MHLAIMGATSQIAKDLVRSIAQHDAHELTLLARHPAAVQQWLASAGLSGRYGIAEFGTFDEGGPYDAIINFVGVGDPAKAQAMGAAIFDVTLKYDEIALDYVRRYPECRYLFISSGAAYGGDFAAPVDHNSVAVMPINQLSPSNWYAAAKLHAECRHRSFSDLNIVDVRVFNYFSHTQDSSARFLIADVLRAIRDKTVLVTSSENIVRDYLHPSDFHQLITALLASAGANTAVDCYSLAPVEKMNMLAALSERFGLAYEVSGAAAGVNATGAKHHYYSLNRRAGDFGYVPRLTALEGVMRELELSLGSSESRQ